MNFRVSPIGVKRKDALNKLIGKMKKMAFSQQIHTKSDRLPARSKQ